MASPTIGITGLTGWGANQQLPQGRFHDTYQLQDSVSWAKGNHFFKFGVDFADIREVDEIPYNTSGSIGYAANSAKYGTAYTALGNYIDDYGGTSATVGKTFGSNYVHANIPSQNYFAEDTWKLRSNLTLNYGVRYEYNGAPSNNLKFPAIDPLNITATNYNTLVKQQPDSSNIGPRISLSYQPRFWKGLFGDGKTAIRGGFGVFYGGIFTNILDNSQAAAPNSAAGLITSTPSAAEGNSRGTGNWAAQIASLTPVLTPQTAVTSQVAHLLSPETLQWNFNIERELPSSFILQLGYTGSRGEHLYAQNQYNPYVGGARINPARGSVLVRDNSGDSIYHALTVNLDRKFRNGFQLRAAYTFSKFIDDTSEVFTYGNWSAYPALQYPAPRGSDRSVSMFDHRQRLVFVYTYDIPKLSAYNGLAKSVGYLTNGWRISGTNSIQSGTPYNVETGLDTNGDGISNDRPDLSNRAAPINTYAWTGDWMASSAHVTASTLCEGVVAVTSKYTTCNVVTPNDVRWIVPSSGVGNFGRNGLVGPKSVNFDFAVNRTIKVHESQAFDFRADIFNLFNHSVPDGAGYYPSFTLTTGIPGKTFADFGTSRHGGRSIRMLFKYSF